MINEREQRKQRILNLLSLSVLPWENDPLTIAQKTAKGRVYCDSYPRRRRNIQKKKLSQKNCDWACTILKGTDVQFHWFIFRKNQDALVRCHLNVFFYYFSLVPASFVANVTDYPAIDFPPCICAKNLTSRKLRPANGLLNRGVAPLSNM